MIFEQSTEGCKEASHVESYMKGLVFWIENIPGNKLQIICGTQYSHLKMGTEDLIRTALTTVSLPGVEQGPGLVLFAL